MAADVEGPMAKIYCHDRDESLTGALLASSNNNQWNNPFVYLVWMMMANRMGWGNNEIPNAKGIELQNQIEALRTQMQDNQNSSMIMDAVKGNACDIKALATQLNCDFNTLSSAICDVRGGIDRLSGQVGFSAERVINAVTLGNCNIIQQLKDCCCTTQKLILEQGYQNQLAQKDQLFAIQGGFDRTNTGLERGFSSVAFQAQQDKCDIIRSGEMNTQRIIDTLNSHWKDEQALQIQDLKFQLSQERQNRLLLSRLGKSDLGCDLCNGGF